MNRKIIDIETVKRYAQLETIINKIDSYYYESARFDTIRGFSFDYVHIEEISDNTYIYDMNSNETTFVHTLIVIDEDNNKAYVHMYSIVNNINALLYDDNMIVEL